MLRILSLFFITFNLLASGITPIKKGEIASHDGFLITKEFEKKARKTNEENKLLKSKNVLLSDLKVVNEQRIDFYKKNAQEANSELLREQFKGSLKGWLMFGLGVVLTGGIAYGLQRTLR